MKLLNYTLLLTALVAFAACKSEADTITEIKREVSKQLLITFNSEANALQVEPEKGAKNLYVATATLGDGTRVQGMVSTDADSLVWAETLNSKVGRFLRVATGLRATSISLKPLAGSQEEYEGTALMDNGAQMKIVAHAAMGWRPQNDLPTLSLLTKMQIQNTALDSGDVITEFALAPDSIPTAYKGNFTSQKGKKANIAVSWSKERFDWRLLQ